MNRIAIACCAVVLSAAAPLSQAQPKDASLPQPRAIEGYYPDTDPPAARTRADVVADVRAARAAGQLGFEHDGDMSAYPELPSAQPRPVRFASEQQRAN